MSRIPFKRHLIILVTCILAIGVIVPIATFAKGTPPGEQKRPQHSAVHSHFQSGQPIQITTDCSSVPLQLLVILNQGDQLTGSATLTTSDPDEESEGETLVIQEQNSSFTKTLLTLDVATGSATIPPLTASVNNDNINACINGIDSDETGTVTLNVKTGPLFIFIRGIDSKLTQDQINATKDGDFGDFNTIFGTILGTPGFENPHVLFFSYTGSLPDGTPQPYNCEDTFVSPTQFASMRPIAAYVNLLNAQLAAALTNSPITDVYLIGHSMGGVVAYGYLASFEAGLGASLPSGVQLKGVFTLDSPIGGVSNKEDFQDTAVNFYKGDCKPLVTRHLPLMSFFDLEKIYPTVFKTPPPEDGGTDPIGGQASIALGLLGGDASISNEIVAETAAASGTSVLTVGNTSDLVFNPSLCNLLAKIILDEVFPAFPATQYIEDEGHNSGAYGRIFTSVPASLACATGVNPLHLTANHFAVLTDTSVMMGISEVLQGQSPTSLKSGRPDLASIQ